MQSQISHHQQTSQSQALLGQNNQHHQAHTYRATGGGTGMTSNSHNFQSHANNYLNGNRRNSHQGIISSLSHKQGHSDLTNGHIQRTALESAQQVHEQRMSLLQKAQETQSYKNQSINNQQNDHQGEINAQYIQNLNNIQHQNYITQANVIQQTMMNQAFVQAQAHQQRQTKAYPVQSRTHRQSTGTHQNNSAIQRYSNPSNMQNNNVNQRGDHDENIQYIQMPSDNIENSRAMIAQQQQQRAASGDCIQRGDGSQNRTDSNGAAPGVLSGGGLHSSGGSIGPHSYKASSGSMMRSRTQGRISSTKSILAMIKCPCDPNPNKQQTTRRDLIRADRGKKQPILLCSENTANCGMCGQFYAIKDSQYTSVGASGKKQLSQQARIIKTIREKNIVFKLDDPVSEVFNRMRKVSNETLKTMRPHPYYLEKRVKRIDNLSYIADTLQTDNQTIHHAVHLMDIYSTKMPRNEEYDTLLISLVALFISTKYLQIKYPGADTLNDLAKRKYSADIIINMEGQVLDTINWNLMIYPIYDYVKLFVSQGCLFENEEILRPITDEIMDDSQIRDKPTVQLAEHFKKYAEFFADFCLYQECFMTVDPYLLACAIVAYTRKYMGVAIIWPTELELLTKCNLHHFRDLYLIIDSKYSENFPKHASSQNYPQQLLTEPVQQNTAQGSLRKDIMNKLQLSSGGKTQKTQNSTVKPLSINNQNINNLLGDLKTPDKCVFDFNSNVSGNKNNTHDKFSKFQMNSNSVEKFRLQKNSNTTQNHKVVSENQIKAQGMVFSDNKKQSINAHSFKKMIQKNQTNNNLSDEKHTHQPLIKNYLAQQKREGGFKIDAKGYSSQNSQGYTQTQNVSEAVHSVTSPSANICENDNEQEVPPFKPMIIKSNSQAIGGGYECKTTTKKSPKGVDLEKINAIKEAVNSVNIQAKLPSSTTNQNSMKLQIHNALANAASNGLRSYGGIGVSNGPIKINQKIKIVTGSNQKSSAKKSQKSQLTQGTSSSQKMKISKSYVAQLKNNGSNLRQNLNNNYYQERLAEQREARAQQNKVHNINRNTSCISHGQTKINPDKQTSYMSGKPKADIYNQREVAAVEQSQYGQQNQRSVLSIKNAAQAIKRKASFHNQTIDLRVNINKNQGGNQQGKEISQQAQQNHIIPQNMVKSKNVPNGLLRRATAGTQGTQKSIGNLSNYHGTSQSLARQSYQNAQINAQSRELSVENYQLRMNHLDAGVGNMTPNSGQGVAVNPPAIMVNTNQNSLIKNKSFSNGGTGSSLNATKATLMKMIQDKGISSNSQNNLHQHHNSTNSHQQYRHTHYVSQPNSGEKNYDSSQDGSKPIQKLIKSGSQVLGKSRQRPKMTRSQMMKELNEKKEKITEFVQAAQNPRCLSNEKTSSTKKPNISDICERPHVQSFTQKFQNHGAKLNPGVNGTVSDFQNMMSQNAHSEERPQYQPSKFQNELYGNNENMNGINMQHQSQKSHQIPNQIKATTYREGRASTGQNVKYSSFRA